MESAFKETNAAIGISLFHHHFIGEVFPQVFTPFYKGSNKENGSFLLLKCTHVPYMTLSIYYDRLQIKSIPSWRSVCFKSLIIRFKIETLFLGDNKFPH